MADAPGFTPAAFVTREKRDLIQFLRCDIDVRAAGRVRLQWNSAKGVTLYIDGKPTPFAADGLYELAAGRRTLTLAVSRHLRDVGDLRLEVWPADSNAAEFTLNVAN